MLTFFASPVCAVAGPGGEHGKWAGGWDPKHRMEKIYCAAVALKLDPYRYTLLQRWAEDKKHVIGMDCDVVPYLSLLLPQTLQWHGRGRHLTGSAGQLCHCGRADGASLEAVRVVR